MKALIIVAHGSRNQASNDEIIAMVKDVHAVPDHAFDLVTHAFIQFTTPLVDTVIDGLVTKGATDIVVFPYFIGAGNHVTKDIPALIDAAREKYKTIGFTLLPHLGSSDKMKHLILTEVAQGQ